VTVIDRATADPVTTEVIRHGLDAAADQMRVNLCRTAFSYVIYEVTDFAAALYDRDIRLLAQAKALPAFLGTLGFAIEATLAQIGGAERLHEGDVLFSTYGYDIGSHQQDATVIVPGFFEGELIGYAVIKAHHLDIGAKDPYCTDTTDIFQEGAIFPGVKLYSGGVRNEDMYRTVLANSRMPQALEGDLNAQIGSARVGLRELDRLLARFGRERFAGAVERIFDHGERVVRDFVRSVPDGRYRASGAMDSNGLDEEPVPIEVIVDVAGEEICVDLTESADQQRGPVNSPLASTVSQMRNGIVSLTGDRGSVNEGHFRPIEVRTRPGSIFHPRPPAPVFLYGWSGAQAMDLVHKALADACPDSVPAGSGGDVCGFIVWGTGEDGAIWVAGADHVVGMGAADGRDMVAPLMHIPCSGVKSGPAEVMEADGHLVVERMELAQDSGGPGRFRGGPGVDFEYRLREAAFATMVMERGTTPPWGLHGGGAARANAARVHLPDGSVRNVRKGTAIELPPGSLLEIATGGGGGYGPVEEREPRAVLGDVREGYVSEAAARRDYPHAFER
jgi:N-methylhydantoinase B